MLVARIADRIGKGIRDAPRDALLADVTPAAIRGSGFGLRLALYTVGAVAGPLAAIALMTLSGDDFRLVFWVALLPGFASVVVLLIGIKEPPNQRLDDRGRFPVRRNDLALLRAPFWWAISIAAIFSLARFSPAFLVLKAHHVQHRCGVRADHIGDHVLDLFGGSISVRHSGRRRQSPSAARHSARSSLSRQTWCLRARVPFG